MQAVTRLPGKKARIPLVSGAFGLLLSLLGLVTAYYYSWRLTAPGLPAGMVPEYELLARRIGFFSLGLLVLSLVLIGLGLNRWMRRATS